MQPKKNGSEKYPEPQSRRYRQEQPTPRHRRTRHNVAQSTHTSDRNVSGTSVGARTSFTFETKADLDGYTRSRGDLGRQELEGETGQGNDVRTS